MTHSVISFPQFPETSILISCFKDIKPSVLSEVKTQLVSGNKDYDFCFLNTLHIISLEHLYSAIHKSILNYSGDSMRAKTLNTEIIFNLSPINNIMDALKRFGVDEGCPNVIIIKVFFNKEETNNIDQIENHLQKLLEANNTQSLELNDDVLFNDFIDIKKFKKVYKLNDAKLTNDENDLQANLTRLAIGACQLRGC